MARVLDRFPKAAKRTYDWDSWFDGRVWELTYEEDFHTKLESFRQTAFAEAKRRFGNIRTCTVEKNRVLAIQFFSDIPEEERNKLIKKTSGK